FGKARKRFTLLLEGVEAFAWLEPARLVPAQTLVHVDLEALPSVFAIVGNIDSNFDLLPHDFGHTAADIRRELLRVIWKTQGRGFHSCDYLARSNQTSAVRGQNSMGTSVHQVGLSSGFGRCLPKPAGIVNC